MNACTSTKSCAIFACLTGAAAADWVCPGGHRTNETVCGQSWNIQCDNSIQGTDIRRFFNNEDGLRSCTYACAEDASCLGTSYVSMTFTCILKKTIDEINLRPGVWSAYPVPDEDSA